MGWLRGRAPELAWTRIAAVAAVAGVALVVGIAIGTSGLVHVWKSPQPTASGAPGPFGETWEQVTVDPTTGRYVIGGFAGQDRVVLTGKEPASGPSIDGLGPAAWYSDDWVTWHQSKVVVTGGSNVEVSDLGPVVQVGNRLVAMARAYTTVVSAGKTAGQALSVPFTSTDGGATWVQATDATPASGGWVRDVVAAGHLYVAVGEDGTTSGGRIWTSSDGLHWASVEATDALAGSGLLTAIAEHDGTLMVVGQLAGNQPQGLILVSPDGLHWTRAASTGLDSAIDITWSDGGWLAAGTGLSRSTDDGATWDAIELPPGDSGGWPLSRSSRGIVAVQDVFDQQGVLVSTDGSTWDWHPLTSRGSGGINVVLARDGRILAAGYASDNQGLPVAWISPARSSSAESTAASPSLLPTASPTPVLSTSPLPESPIFTAWSRVDLPDPAPDEFGGTITRGLVRFGDRWIAVGFVNGGCCAGGYSEATRGVLWTSSDGEHWALVPPQESLAHARIYSVATNGKAIVAVGIVEVLTNDGAADPLLQPASWYSTDGTTWHLVGNAPSLALVTAAGGRFVAASDADRMVTFYTSVDGHAWSQTSGIGPGEADPKGNACGVLGLAGRPDGWVVAVGDVTEPDAGGGGTDSATIWSAFDPEAGIEMTSNTDGAWMNGVVVQDGGWRAVGSTIDGTTVLSWSLSGDASPSQPSTVEQDANGGIQVQQVVMAGDAVVVTGSGPAEAGLPGGGTIVPRIWVNLGSAWYRVTDPALLSARPELSVAAWDESGSRMLLMSSASDGTHPIPVLWIAPR